MGDKWGIKAEETGLQKPGTQALTPERLIQLERLQGLSPLSSGSENALGARNCFVPKVHSTDSVGPVTTMRDRAMHRILVMWWRLTGPFPRLLPDTDEKILALRETLIQFYGLEDRPDVWLTVCGQMASVPISSKRISYQRLATAGHRLTTNAVVKKHKDIEIGKLHARLEEIAKEMAAEASEPAVSSETHDLHGDVQALQSTKAGVVSESTADGIY